MHFIIYVELRLSPVSLADRVLLVVQKKIRNKEEEEKEEEEEEEEKLDQYISVCSRPQNSENKNI